MQINIKQYYTMKINKNKHKSNRNEERKVIEMNREKYNYEYDFEIFSNAVKNMKLDIN